MYTPSLTPHVKGNEIRKIHPNPPLQKEGIKGKDEILK
jgi:hypothetical protein